VPASQIHLVRHGEVFNPSGVLYGRIPGYGLSDLGHRMAEAAALDLKARQRPVTRLMASPLQRAQESAAPIAEAFALPILTEDRLIEPTNRFEGTVTRLAVRKPVNWPYLINPRRPSWGEPYVSIVARMLAAIEDAYRSVDDGDVVLVSHQLPIWMVHSQVTGKSLPHNPNRRRCSLSSITTLAPVAGGTGDEGRPVRFEEVGYSDPAAGLLDEATDVGAV